jgi:hypothetical protein
MIAFLSQCCICYTRVNIESRSLLVIIVLAAFKYPDLGDGYHYTEDDVTSAACESAFYEIIAILISANAGLSCDRAQMVPQDGPTG